MLIISIIFGLIANLAVVEAGTYIDVDGTDFDAGTIAKICFYDYNSGNVWDCKTKDSNGNTSWDFTTPDDAGTWGTSAWVEGSFEKTKHRGPYPNDGDRKSVV